MSALTCVLPLRGAAVKGGAEAALRYALRQIASYFRGWKSFKHNYCLIVVGLLTPNCFQNDLSYFFQALWLLCLSKNPENSFSSANTILKSNKGPLKFML